MKVLVFVKATPNSEKGIPAPTEELQKMFNDMGKFNEKLVKAGVMQEADGLKPSSFGKRLRFSGSGAPTVIDGPFAETKELVAGYWIWTVKSVEEAVEWAKQCPNPMPGEEGVLEIRPTFSMEDFDDLATPEISERNQRLEKEMARRRKAQARGQVTKKAKAKSLTRRAPVRKKARPTRARSKK